MVIVFFLILKKKLATFSCGGEGATSCMGDSGGPLIVQWEGSYELLGSVSWGSGKCDVNQAGVYSNWAYPDARAWLTEETGL